MLPSTDFRSLSFSRPRIATVTGANRRGRSPDETISSRTRKIRLIAS
jgi:hypothetical protein